MMSHEMVAKDFVVLKRFSAAWAEKAPLWVSWVNILLVLESLLWNNAFFKVAEHGLLVRIISSAEPALIESCESFISSADCQL